jgi:hypothetical protein
VKTILHIRDKSRYFLTIYTLIYGVIYRDIIILIEVIFTSISMIKVKQYK